MGQWQPHQGISSFWIFYHFLIQLFQTILNIWHYNSKNLRSLHQSLQWDIVQLAVLFLSVSIYLFIQANPYNRQKKSYYILIWRMNPSLFLPFNYLLSHQKAWWLLSSFSFWQCTIIILYKWKIEFLFLRYLIFIQLAKVKTEEMFKLLKKSVCSFQYVQGDSNILIQTETEFSFSHLEAHSQFGFKQLSVGCITSSNSDVQILNCKSLTLNSRIQVENIISICSSKLYNSPFSVWKFKREWKFYCFWNHSWALNKDKS